MMGRVWWYDGRSRKQLVTQQLVLSSLTAFFSVLNPQRMGQCCPESWRASPPHSNLETPSETCAKICYHGDSKSCEVDIPD